MKSVIFEKAFTILWIRQPSFQTRPVLFLLDTLWLRSLSLLASELQEAADEAVHVGVAGKHGSGSKSRLQILLRWTVLH